MELAALEHLKNSNRLIMGKCCLHAGSFILDRIIIKVASNQDRRKSSDEFDFRPDQTFHFGVTCPWMTKNLHFSNEYLWGHSTNLDQILCVASLGVGKGCIMFWGWRLKRWAYSIPMVRRPSAVVIFHTFKLKYLWSQLANLDKFLCVASLGQGKGCIRFWGRLDQNSGVHGNRKPPLTYNGENDVATVSRLLLIWSFLYLQVTRTCIKSRASSNFDQIGPLTTELAALERLKNCP